MRKNEYFTEQYNKSICSESIGMIPRKLFMQERDWTCSIACIRTLLSSLENKVPSEDYIVIQYKMKPGPYYSKDIKSLQMLDKYNAIYGCDKTINYDINYIIDLMKNNYYVMVESMINYDHWLVVLAYINLSNNNENNYIILYDPYYNEIKQIRVDEFIGMWCSGEHEVNKIVNDFIAIKK